MYPESPSFKSGHVGAAIRHTPSDLQAWIDTAKETAVFP